MTSYPNPYTTSGEPSRYYPRGGDQYWTPHAYNVRRPDPEVGYAPAYHPGQGYPAGDASKRRNSLPWWTNPGVYPDPPRHDAVPYWTNPDINPDLRYYYEGNDWAGNNRFEGSYVTDPRARGNNQPPRRTREGPAPPDSAGLYRPKRGQSKIPLDQLKSSDVVGDVEEAKQRKDWLWRRVAVKNVDDLTPKVLDGSFIKNYGYIK